MNETHWIDALQAAEAFCKISTIGVSHSSRCQFKLLVPEIAVQSIGLAVRVPIETLVCGHNRVG